MRRACGENMCPRSNVMDRRNKRRLLSFSRPGFWIIIAAVVLGGSGLMIYLSSARDEEQDNKMPTFRVKRGPLTIGVSESGTIKAREQLIIKSLVEGSTTILSLVPEGTRVRMDELLIELDASKLQDQRVNEQILVMNTEAAFIRARENLAVTKNQVQSDIDKAEEWILIST
jgi:HlyD family secretion protein